MAEEQIKNEYFDWMYQLVCDDQTGPSWRKLLRALHETEFVYVHTMDRNRAKDGADLRYRFGFQHEYPTELIEEMLDTEPCSVLEMMLALVIRCEEHIMCDADIGNRTAQWFWGMIQNLGLDDMTDAHFDAARTAQILNRFINREYEPNGKGGLFTVNRSRYDMRAVEIWYQMMWYLDEYLQK